MDFHRGASDVSDISSDDESIPEDQAISPVLDSEARRNPSLSSETQISSHQVEPDDLAVDDQNASPESTHAPNPNQKKTSPSAAQWPQEPKPLGKLNAWQTLFLAIDILATLLPIFFIVLSTAALSLNGQPKSRFGDGVIEATKYGTTAFPFVFGAVIARLLKTIALWRCEYGAKLGIVEQLVGSQSLVATVERFVQLRQHDFVAFGLLFIWAFSPFGSQMTLRLLTLADSNVQSVSNVSYFNVSVDGTRATAIGSAFESESGLVSFRSALVTLVGASMLASESVRQSTVDQWGSVKIPYISDIPSDGSWIAIRNATRREWISLSGIMTTNISPSANSTYMIETSYLDVTCTDPVSLPLGQSLALDLRSKGFNLLINNISNPWVQPIPGTSGNFANSRWNSDFLDTLNTTALWPSPTPKSLIYGSLTSTNVSNGPDTLEIFNCTLEFPRIDAKVSCLGQSCAVTHLRRSSDDFRNRQVAPMGFTSYASMLTLIPTALGLPHFGVPSAVQQYVFGANNPFSVGLKPIEDDLPDRFGSFVAGRLTTLLNTVWQASLCPFAIGSGLNANLSNCLGSRPDMPNMRQANTTANTTRALPRSQYQTTIWHAAVLLFISVLLQIAGILTVTIMALTKAPNLFGYVSTLLKDNAYITVPPGGSTLDGPDRAKYLAKMRIKIADVRPEDEVGYLAFCTETDEEHQSYRQLQRGRLYA